MMRRFEKQGVVEACFGDRLRAATRVQVGRRLLVVLRDCGQTECTNILRAGTKYTWSLLHVILS